MQQTAVKLNATAMVFLMLATTLAWGTMIPPTSTQLTTLSTILSNVQGSQNGSIYQTMVQISAQLKSTAATIQNYADTAEKNGTLTQFKSAVLAHKTQFFGTPNHTTLYNAFLLAQKHGYQQGFNDFSRQALSFTQTQKQNSWNYLQNHTAHDGLIALAGLYIKAANDLDAQAAQVKANGSKLVLANFHVTPPGYYNLMSRGDCNAADVLAGLYILAGMFAPNPITLGMMAVGTIWYATRFYFC